jgi:type III secretion protein U
VSDKTEEPTPKRLKKAREEGDSPVSGAVLQGFGFVVAMALAPAAFAAAAARVGDLLRRAVLEPPRPLSSVELARDVVVLSAPLVAAAAAAAAAAGLVQTGGIVATKKIAPDLAKLNPVSGLSNVFSAQRLVSLARALVGALLVGYLAVKLLMTHAADVANTVGEPALGAVAAGALLKKLGWIAALVGLALGALDLVVVRRSWLRRLRMSKDEIKREYKESEGDPELKAARKRTHQEMLASATIAAVRQATVLVVNPTHLATALEYDEERDEAPRVVASGEGDLARRMIEAAHAYGVPVLRDVPVARALSELEVGDEVPEALYEAVAEILREAWAEAEKSGER